AATAVFGPCSKSRFHLRTTEELTSNSRASPESVISPRRTRSICSFLKAVVNSRRPSAPLRNSPILLLLEEVQHNLSQVSTPIGGRRIDDEDRRVREHLEALLELARGLGLFEAGDEIGERAVVDAPPTLGRGNGQADGQVRLADAGRAQEDDVLFAFDEAELVEALDLFSSDRGLEAEVEALERLYGRKAGGPHGGLEPSVVPELDLG